MHNIVKLCVAGGGKTTKIIEYIQNLKNIDKERILLISFSNATVKDLESKLKLKAYTLHSFCIGFDTTNSSIIDNYYHLIDYLKQNYIKLRYISTTVLNNWIYNYELCNHLNDIDNISNISLVDIELNKQFQSLIQEIYKNIYNQRSFTQILQHFLLNIDNILPLIYTKFDYLIIDEAQDLSFLQLNIIYKMIENIFSYENKGFIIVGDPQQIIYGFQGASILEYRKFLIKIRKLCKLRGLKMEIESHNITYRFGGEILKHINTLYNKHTSLLNEGKYIQHIYENIQNTCNIIQQNINIYGIDNVFVLFKRNSSVIESIQNQLNNGMNIKIYLYGHFIHSQLQLIYNYLTTYGNAKNTFQFRNSIFKYKSISEFISNIKQYSYNNFLLFEYLNSIVVFNTDIDSLLWREIYELSFQYISFIEMFVNLPIFITINQPGIQFLTIHAAKGLETQCVIFINENNINTNTIIHKGLLLKNYKYNLFTKNIYNEYLEEQKKQNENLYYVAMTRSTHNIIEIIV